MIQKVIFQPWVGSNYFCGGVFGKRILVLGESHHCQDQCDGCGKDIALSCSNFTRDVLTGYLNPDSERERWMNTFLKFERSLVGHCTDWEERRQIWESLAFYNYLQSPMTGPRQAGLKVQYQRAQEPFKNVLEVLKPELLIVWGHRLWSRLPENGWTDGPDVEVDNYQVMNGFYHIKDGHSVRAVSVYHPAAGYSWDFWHKVIKAILTY